MKNNKYIKIADVPSMLPICAGTAKNLVAAGVLPSVRIGRGIFIPRDGLQRFIDKGGGGLPPRAASAGARSK